jgi:type I restriction enzyme, R subunit
MQRHLQPAVDRFKAIADEEQRTEFREKLSGYVQVYAFLSQIIPYADPELEMLHSYGRFLLPHLPKDRDGEVIRVGDDVTLQYGEAQYVRSPTEVGTGKAQDEKLPLSQIIQVLNDRFGTQFTDEDRLSSSRSKRKPARINRSSRPRLLTRWINLSWAFAN